MNYKWTDSMQFVSMEARKNIQNYVFIMPRNTTKYILRLRPKGQHFYKRAITIYHQTSHKKYYKMYLTRQIQVKGKFETQKLV